MTIIYLRSTTGSDVNSGATWALAKATLAAALTAAGVGGTVYMSQLHAESQATAISLASPGTVAAPVKVICANDAAQPPTALATTGTVTCTGTAADVNHTGSTWFYGITIKSARNIQLTGSTVFFNACTLQLTTVGTGLGIIASSYNNGSNVLLYKSNVTFAENYCTFNLNNANFTWRGGVLSTPSASIPIIATTQDYGKSNITIQGVDFGVFNAGVQDSQGGLRTGRTVVENCKIPATYTNTSRPAEPMQFPVSLHASDSAGTNYRKEEITYEGTVSQETTIVLTGGASDGTTAFSRKMVSTANAGYVFPLLYEVALWNDTVGAAKTATIEFIHDSLIALKDNEIWMEAEYMGSTTSPIASYIDNSSNILVAGAAQAASTATWTTTGLTNPNKQKLAVSFTPQLKGYVKYRVYLAKPSYTAYVDPKVTVA
jgi:hypothetical protein